MKAKQRCTAWTRRLSLGPRTLSPPLLFLKSKSLFAVTSPLAILCPLEFHTGDARMQGYDLFMIIILAAAVIWGAWKGLA